MTPEISIIIATFNSMKTLPLVIESITKQDIAKEKVEILLIDGFSSDGTRDLCKVYPNLKIIDNIQIDPVNAKYIGFLNATSPYLIYLDHDEVIDNENYLSNIISIYESDINIAGVYSAGYKTPKNYPFISEYINAFGDPFSGYFYGLSKNHNIFQETMKSRYKTIDENEFFVEFEFLKNNLPIIELCAAGSSIRRSFLTSFLTTSIEIPLIFNTILTKNHRCVMAKYEVITHYSSDNVSIYMNKIKWRIKNNLFNIKNLGDSGFKGREKESGINRKFKKYCFIPYSLLIIPCLIQSLIWAYKYKNIKYIFHVFLSFYTAFWIVLYITLKTFKFSPDHKSYDGSKVLSK